MRLRQAPRQVLWQVLWQVPWPGQAARAAISPPTSRRSSAPPGSCVGLTSCHWAFYDRSPTSSGCWCSMAVCGSRAKSRAYRRRAASRS
ncbi:MAG TPA: CGNR zinc finger domain-containing protein [Streptosporangiaceae bacterium]